MAHNSAYTKIWREAGNGLALHDVARCLGVSSKDLGTLCRSEAIRKWSKVKPVRHSSIGDKATADIMKEANYGFGGSDMFSNVDAAAVFDMALANACDWPYLRPRGIKAAALNPTDGNEWFRILDFDGYDHESAIPPVAVDFGSITDADNEDAKRFYLDFFVMGAAGLKLLDFSIADLERWDSINDFNFKYAVMIRRHGSSGAPSFVYGINVFKYENGAISYNHKESEGANEEIVFDWPVAPSTTVYDVVPCIVRHNAAGNGTVIYLPAGQVYQFDAYSGTSKTYVTGFTIKSKSGVTAPTQAEAAAGTGVFNAVLDTTFSYTAQLTPREQTVGKSIPFKFRVNINGVWGDYVTRYCTIGNTGAHSWQASFGYDDYPPIPCPKTEVYGGYTAWLEVSVDGLPVLENYPLYLFI